MIDDPQVDPVEAAAADWLVRRDRGLSRADERAFAQWREADPRHAATYDALSATWDLVAEAPSGGARYALGEARIARRTWLPVILAAAAAVAIAYVGWFQPRRAGAEGSTNYSLRAATEVGHFRKVELPDGSIIQLNTDSAVDVRFAAAERRVQLTRGEAHFTVSRNEARPFIVSAAGVDVRVVGTVFNVRLRSEAVDVLVTEGRVRVAGADAGTAQIPPAPTALASELTAGQKLSIALALSVPAAIIPAMPVPVTTAEIRQMLAWQDRRLDFGAAPLHEIVAELNRYNRHQLIVADPRLNEQRFGGSFPASDYATFVRTLEADFDVVAERRKDETLLRLRGR